MRTYEQDVEVWFDDQPRKFIWRGVLLRVERVQAHWATALPWWKDLSTPELLIEQETWRLEASRGTYRGVYDLARTIGAEDWRLVAVAD